MSGVKGQRSGGHNRKSAHLHVLQGTFRAHRHGSADVPRPPAGQPTPRKALAGDAKQEWARVTKELEDAGALAEIDAGRLYQYVSLFAEVEAIKIQATTTQMLLTKAKRAIRGLEGAELLQAIEQLVKLQQIAVRQTTQLRQGHMAIRQYLNDFGMTPVARHGKLSGEAPKSKLDQFRAARGRA